MAPANDRSDHVLRDPQLICMRAARWAAVRAAVGRQLGQLDRAVGWRAGGALQFVWQPCAGENKKMTMTPVTAAVDCFKESTNSEILYCCLSETITLSNGFIFLFAVYETR